MVSWFPRRRRAHGAARRRDRPGRGTRLVDREGVAHLEAFAAERRGVEGFVEPPTAVTPTTLLLVAADGAWTRRRVPDAAYAHDFANRLGIPSYDAQVVGYPQRMRDWNARQRSAEPER